uniref:Vacuolar protein sorting-associated protein 26-like protein n=1 Tax=Rhizophora mucronata TaxID=61149 RepID=A0A2P2KR99_RHIMU
MTVIFLLFYLSKGFQLGGVLVFLFDLVEVDDCLDVSFALGFNFGTDNIWSKINYRKWRVSEGSDYLFSCLQFVSWMSLEKYMKEKHIHLNSLRLKCHMRHTMG